MGCDLLEGLSSDLHHPHRINGPDCPSKSRSGTGRAWGGWGHPVCSPFDFIPVRFSTITQWLILRLLLWPLLRQLLGLLLPSLLWCQPARQGQLDKRGIMVAPVNPAVRVRQIEESERKEERREGFTRLRATAVCNKPTEQASIERVRRL
jgi:hypothetical protein